MTEDAKKFRRVFPHTVPLLHKRPFNVAHDIDVSLKLLFRHSKGIVAEMLFGLGRVRANGSMSSSRE